MRRINLCIALFLLTISLFGCNEAPATVPTNTAPTETTSTTTMPTEPTQPKTKTIYIRLSEHWTYLDYRSGATRTVDYIYDANNCLLEIKNVYGSDRVSSCLVTCDQHGRSLRIEHTDLGSYTEEFTYDEYDRVKTYSVYGCTREYTYDEAGNLIRVTEPVGHGSNTGVIVWEYIYNNGLLAEKIEYGLEGQKQMWNVYKYDSFGRLIRQTQNSVDSEPIEMNYSYSEDGLTCTMVYNGSTEVKTYDAHGNVIRLEFSNSLFHYVCEYSYKPIEIPVGSQWKPYVDQAPH